MNYALFILMILISLGMPIIVYNSREELSDIAKVGLLCYGLAMFLVAILGAIRGFPNL